VAVAAFLSGVVLALLLAPGGGGPLAASRGCGPRLPRGRWRWRGAVRSTAELTAKQRGQVPRGVAGQRRRNRALGPVHAGWRPITGASSTFRNSTGPPTPRFCTSTRAFSGFCWPPQWRFGNRARGFGPSRSAGGVHVSDARDKTPPGPRRAAGVARLDPHRNPSRVFLLRVFRSPWPCWPDWARRGSCTPRGCKWPPGC